MLLFIHHFLGFDIMGDLRDFVNLLCANAIHLLLFAFICRYVRY